MVVGPEVPLANGIVDRFHGIGIPIFGPTKAAAQIESSKVFAKELMQQYKIPCARSASFSSYAQANKYVGQQTPPLWIKADGLAAGKGAIFAGSTPEAAEILHNLMEMKILGAAGDKVIIEECLSGREVSAFVFTDGVTVAPMVSACDYKRIYDKDRGPNTGGMGSFSPSYFLSPSLVNAVNETIMAPAIRAMAEEKMPYRSVLYGGLMITEDEPKVIEFNARFGDPETQVVLPRLQTDLVDIIMAVITGNLNQINIEWSEDACVGVVMASAGYPGKYKTGFPVTGLDNLDKEIMVFHAGTKINKETGQVLTGGGRVLTVAAKGKTTTEAREKVYLNLPRIHFEGSYYRRDIAEIKNA